MPIPAPDLDTVLLREHAFRDTKNLELVLPKEDLDGFVPIEKLGLGHFNYKLVDLNAVFESGKASYKSSWLEELREFFDFIKIDKILLIIISILIFSLFVKLITRRNVDTTKKQDIETAVNDTLNDIGQSYNDITSKLLEIPSYLHHQYLQNSVNLPHMKPAPVYNKFNEFDYSSKYQQPIVVDASNLQTRLRLD